ncbi:endosome-associated-trafficking regulator 1 isoform X2 [Photinus pyralis]|uniref:endosome-associated-trafficking regulator 1 isoform X2 n=1 Tax=Photinus pyralis TaxID=7054 RepID=UPI001267369D|nr:endosome-associated-trafficking regulator 1 isoform X2 [Photinus pyralis]
MAEGDNFPNDRHSRHLQESADSDHSDSESMRLDLGINHSPSYVNGAGTSNVNETPKREDNPFSFKHFLRSDVNNYQNQGARPKVYCDGRPISSISDLNLHKSNAKQMRIVPEFSSALPDFVQDHLVVEQCYSEDTNNFNLDLNNLPDFAVPHGHCSHLNGESSRSTDLPIADHQPAGSRSCPTSVEVAGSKSLPDFLTDGAVRSQGSDDNQINHSPESEIDRLRVEVESYRQQLAEQNRRVEQLQLQLDAARNKEQEYTKNLVKALEHVEESLDRSNQRAASAESIIAKLRQEIRSLKGEINRLRDENGSLRNKQGSTSRPNTMAASNDSQSQRLSQELRASANTAENSLRQLLVGVDNLRMIAATLENMNRIEERTESFSDIEDDAGPAL